MTTVVDIEALEARYREAILELPPKANNLRDYLVRRTLESRKTRVLRIRELLAVERFELVFIGRIGTGKTTSICNLFKLTSDVERGKSLSKRTEPVLTTGTGRSTICEVEIVRHDHTALEIDPLSPDEVRSLLEDFRDSIFARMHLENYEKPTDGLTSEVDRAIRNIIELTAIEREGKVVDPAMELARQTSDGRAFLDAVLRLADLDSRQERRAVFPGGNELAWLRDTFKKINVGRCAGFSIPKRIRVFLGPAISGDERTEFVNHVVDTKGLDEILVRTDIDSYIERDDALCLFTSSFAGAPDGEVLSYVERHLQDTTSGFERRCILLVLPRNGEAANLLGPDGNPVDDEGAGETLKSTQAHLAFQNRGLDFVDDNIVFYDALRGYEKGRLVDHEAAEEGRRAFFDRIADIVSHRREQLHESANILGEDLSNLLRESAELRPEDAKIVSEMHALLRQSAVDVRADDFVYVLMQYIRLQRRAIQFHALNRRFGVHGEISLYEFARSCTRDLVRRATFQEQRRVSACVAGIRERASSELAPFLAEIEEQLQIRYEIYLKAVATNARDLVKKMLTPLDSSNEFWRAAIAEWGKGPKYWERESNDYEQGLEGIAEKIMTFANDAWKVELTDPLATFLSEG
jgi:hypothetical protein